MWKEFKEVEDRQEFRPGDGLDSTVEGAIDSIDDYTVVVESTATPSTASKIFVGPEFPMYRR